MKKQKFTIGDVVIYTFLAISALSCFIPLLHVLACSIASPNDMASSKFLLFPKEFSFSAIKYIINTPTFPRALWNSTWTTVVATAFSMFATTLLAYPLSHHDLKGRSVIMFLLVFTMIFNPGLIPGYLNMKRLGLLNTWWSLLIPQMISTYNLILIKNYFQSIPVELREAAKCDGAGDFRIYWQIILPLAKPVLATVALFYAVANWNSYLNAILFVNDDKMWPIQVILRNVVFSSQVDMGGSSGSAVMSTVNIESLKYAVIVVATIPILLVYPFVQKHFKKGVMLGAVKG